jgi:S-adenosylmethionine:tRNA ribosyltransferase-isomerase
LPRGNGRVAEKGVLRTADLDYELPQERIATHPAHPRDAARLMVVDRADPSRISHRVIRDLPDLLCPGDLLVFNTTRVLPARFRGQRIGTGGKMEGLFLSEGTEARRHGGTEWVCLIKGRHTRAGAEFELFDRDGKKSGVRLVVTGRPADEPEAWLAEVVGGLEGPSLLTHNVLERVGLTPLPPYILKARKDAGDPGDEGADREEYQTVFARESGSVAAPTAGLHFTPELLARLDERGIRRAEVVLHVGTGTFRPVETEFVEQHPMHFEWCSMSAEALSAVRETKARGGRVIPVGTTAARTLEAYAAATGASLGEAGLPKSLETNLLITPGYRFRWVDGLLTNYHLPRSTLMAMVAALLPGDGVASLKRLYAEALRHGYRFYSFGDAMLVLGQAADGTQETAIG